MGWLCKLSQVAVVKYMRLLLQKCSMGFPWASRDCSFSLEPRKYTLDPIDVKWLFFCFTVADGDKA